MDPSYDSQEWIAIGHEQNSRTNETLKRLLEGQVGAVDTAQRIAEIYEPAIKSGYGERSLGGLFANISAEASMYDDIRAKRLAELVVALHSLPNCQDAQGRVIMVTGGVVWRDLPLWPYNFAEWSMRIEEIYPSHEALGPTSIFTEGGVECDPAKAQDLLNASTFGAHLLVSLPLDDVGECGAVFDYASIALDMALERFHKSEQDAAAPWRLLILPATTWILIAGHRIHQLCHLILPASSTKHFAMSREWPQTFCPERWSFWKQALGQLEEPSGLEERQQGAALRALERMDELDQT